MFTLLVACVIFLPVIGLVFYALRQSGQLGHFKVTASFFKLATFSIEFNGHDKPDRQRDRVRAVQRTSPGEASTGASR